MQSLLYISRSTMPPERAEAAVRAMVDDAARRNAPLDLTGALLFTGGHFAQVLEGDAAQVDPMLARIRRDPRHDGMIVVDRRIVAERRFDRWTMAYLGPSQFVSRHVTRLLHDPAPADRRRAVAWLSELLREFATA